MSHKKTNDGLY